MIDLNTTSSDLFGKIRSRFSNIKIGDETGALTNDPAKARFFDVNYKVAGKDLGRVNIKLDKKSLTVIYNQAMTNGQAESTKSKWFEFLKELRQFAKKNMLGFDTRDITKSNLDTRDYTYLSKKTGESDMKESKLFGTSKTSYQDMGEAKIIVKHHGPVNYNNPAGRTQRIESIYVESPTGERFRYPHKHLNGARAMARHVANGGTAYDDIGQYISGLSEEMGRLKQFKNYVGRNAAISEAFGTLNDRVLSRIDQIKSELFDLQKQVRYEQFKTEFKPNGPIEVPQETANQWVEALTLKSFNEDLKSVFPYIYKLMDSKDDGLTYDDIVGEAAECDECGKDPCECDDEVKENSMFSEFEQSMDDITTFEYDLPEEEELEYESEEPELAQQQPVVPPEVIEYIKSMYDVNTGTFPRGEEGVKIAVEKKFGETAGRFAHYVVEKLSAKNQPAMQETDIEVQPETTEPEELVSIRRLAGI